MAKITVMLGSGKVGDFPMRKTPFLVGREAKDGVLIENVGVSRSHCRFVYENERYYVEDLGSSNGTFLQGQRVTRAEVRDGDQIGVGKYMLLFHDSGMEFIPESARGAAPRGPAPPGQAGGGGGEPGAMQTFQVDSATLREQMAKAGAAADAVADQDAKRAAQLASRFDPEAIAVAKKRRGAFSYVMTGVKLLGLAIIGAGILIAIIIAML